MRWEDVDLDVCYEYLKNCEDSDFVDMQKEIMNRYAKGLELTVKQKNVVKRMYIIDVLDVNIFEDESICNLPYEEIRRRLGGE